MYRSPMVTRLLVGMFTPAIRATPLAPAPRRGGCLLQKAGMSAGAQPQGDCTGAAEYSPDAGGVNAARSTYCEPTERIHIAVSLRDHHTLSGSGVKFTHEGVSPWTKRPQPNLRIGAAHNDLLDLERRGIEFLRGVILVLDDQCGALADRNVDFRWRESMILDRHADVGRDVGKLVGNHRSAQAYHGENQGHCRRPARP